ncbi:hypothetical protein FF38_13528 [Lucilia cuprina]|uniref:Uncharacterized protein n=1 Tax=Lucilia cuprina TaxID=7375 RepID=A0A0L0CEL1_LUCCU|nr:hypothetical protein FF38_13528 [Lucilia cuprina]
MLCGMPSSLVLRTFEIAKSLAIVARWGAIISQAQSNLDKGKEPITVKTLEPSFLFLTNQQSPPVHHYWNRHQRHYHYHCHRHPIPISTSSSSSSHSHHYYHHHEHRRQHRQRQRHLSIELVHDTCHSSTELLDRKFHIRKLSPAYYMHNGAVVCRHLTSHIVGLYVGHEIILMYVCICFFLPSNNVYADGDDDDDDDDNKYDDHGNRNIDGLGGSSTLTHIRIQYSAKT